MASLEHRILSKVLHCGDLGDAVKAGLSEKQFKDAEARQIWRYLREHWHAPATIKTLPSVRAIQSRWPAFKMIGIVRGADEDDDEDAQLRALIHDLKLTTLETDARSIAAYFQELVETDGPEEAIRAMQGCLIELTRQFRESEHIGLQEVIENAMEHYGSAQSGLVYGLPWPWACLTEDTLGKRPGDFIVFYARMKQMKTWLMLYLAVHDFLENNARVLIWSREMNKEKMCLRLASLLAKVDYQLFKKGKLPRKVQKRAWATFKQLIHSDTGIEITDENGGIAHRKLILMCGRDAPRDLEVIQGNIKEYQPDVVYLDSFYHMETVRQDKVREHNRRIAILSEDVKTLAEDEMIPIIAIHQANRLGEKTHGNTMADMSDSDVIAREADLVARVIKRKGKELHEEDYEIALEQERKRDAAREEAQKAGGLRIGRPRLKMRKEQIPGVTNESEDAPRVGAELAIVLPGNREGVLDAFTIHAVPGYNFDFISSDYSLSEIEDWIKQDDTDKQKEAKKKDTKPKFTSSTYKAWENGRAKEQPEG